MTPCFLPWHKVWLSKEFFYYLDFALMKEIWWCPLCIESKVLLCQITVLHTVLLYTSFRLYVLFKKLEYLFLVYCPSSKSCCIPVCEASIEMTIRLIFWSEIDRIYFLFCLQQFLFTLFLTTCIAYCIFCRWLRMFNWSIHFYLWKKNYKFWDFKTPALLRNRQWTRFYTNYCFHSSVVL